MSASIQLNWTAATDNVAVTTYHVERRPDENSAFSEIGTTSSTSYLDTGLTVGTPYGYRVRAADAAANLGPYTPAANSATYLLSDTFTRSDSGSLGTGWANIPEGGLGISSNKATGTLSGTSVSGSYRTDTFSNDQYSEITIPFNPSNAIMVSVRNQAGGTCYALSYAWNSGSPVLRLLKRLSGGAYSLITSVSSPVLAVGARVRLMVLGNELAGMVNGLEQLSAVDTDITSGAPGILISGIDVVDNWGGGNAVPEIHYLSTDSNGVESYHIISGANAHGIHTLRVLRPVTPVAGKAHQFLYSLEVVEEGNYSFGDPIATLRGLDAHDQYNVTVISPGFYIQPWYADHATDTQLHYETFVTNELRPWVKANLATSYSEQHWIISFSKSGFGGIDFILKHPTLFNLLAAWDFPSTTMTNYNTYGGDPNYGTDANFQANYRLTSTFMDSTKTPFLTADRIWIGGYKFWQTDVDDYHAELSSRLMLHSYSSIARTDHSWDAGWVPAALDALYNKSLLL